MSTPPTLGASRSPRTMTRELAVLLEPGFVVPAGAILAAALAYYAFTWGSVEAFTVAMDHCPEPLCDFQRYYYPMGREIFVSKVPASGFFYSPLFALLLAPFAALGPDGALVGWAGAQVILILILVLLPALLGIRSRGFLLLHLALVLTAFPVLHNLKWGQVSTLLVAALLFGLALYRHDRRGWAAFFFAVAVAVKFYPALFLALFLLRRDLKTLAIAGGMIVLLMVVVPSVLLGFGPTIEFYRILVETLGIAQETMVQDTNSQYLPSVISRVAGHFGYGAPAPDALLRIVGYFVGAVNIVLAHGALLLDRDEGSIWTIVLLFLSLPFVVPTSWPHYFVYLPFCQVFLLQQIGAGSDSRTRKALVSGLFVIPSIVCSSVFLLEAAGGGEVYGFLALPFIANLMLLPACYLVMGPGAVGQVIGRTSEGPT